MAATQSGTRPKPRTLSDGALEGLLLIFCILWLMGCTFVFFFCAISLGPDWLRYWQLRQEGQVTTGRITFHELGDFWHAYIFQYPTGQPGQQQIGHQSVRSGRYPPLLPGETVSIRYLPDDPQISVIESFFETPAKAALLILGLGVAAFSGGLLFLPGRWQAWRGIYRLKNHGELAPAKIINRWRTVDDADRSRYCVAYRFTAARSTGAEQIIVAAETNQLAYEQLRIGDHTPVRYLPQAPQSCRLDMEPLLRQQPEVVHRHL